MVKDQQEVTDVHGTTIVDVEVRLPVVLMALTEYMVNTRFHGIVINGERPMDTGPSGPDDSAARGRGFNEGNTQRINKIGAKQRRGRGRIRGVGRGDTSRNPESESNTQTIEQAGLREKKNRRKRLSTNSLDDEIHDLPPRERIEKLLLADKYECAICLKRIRRNQLAFMCQQCYHIFHISRSQTATGNSGSGCLTEWAFTSYTAEEICHPGPCPGCPAMKVISCGCGREEKAIRCGTGVTFQCRERCGKSLNCGQHYCEETCHSGPCNQCESLIHRECYCGSENQILPCSAENLRLDENFSCGKPCTGMFSCGEHQCDKKFVGRSSIVDCTPVTDFATLANVTDAWKQVSKSSTVCVVEQFVCLRCPVVPHSHLKLIIRCPCGRLTAESKCFDIECEHKRKRAAKLMDAADERGLIDQVESEITDEKYISLQCDSECKRLIRNRKIFEALELDKRQTEIYSEFLLEQVNRDDEFIRSVENIFTDIVSSAQRSRNVDKMSYVFSALSADRRKAIHDYAPHFKIETKSSGIGQQRNTTVTARYTSGFPNVYLTAFRGKKSCFDKQKDAMPAEDGQLKKLENSRPVVRRF
ncbi:hypothetical protein QR680_012971 [Steinernema hermaphroditum]|uniref:R3H domain-containing protein n=1 Tax=Steinernema hermaphroditum TaxID=289476 RepID=A0AA39I6H9_9BILA|nr:hypothetical protein QR680_012971 [Steinernema hermaphroditum]